jgi:hypothetical protein
VSDDKERVVLTKRPMPRIRFWLLTGELKKYLTEEEPLAGVWPVPESAPSAATSA